MNLEMKLKKLQIEIEVILDELKLASSRAPIALGRYMSVLAEKKCPYCRSTQIKVVRTQKPRRYYKCFDCGETWRSSEYFRIRRMKHGD